ncbi:hypothetical protein CspeluHIS016_0203360 [Cutaneotrichosporon spelunceum]|uniref:Histone deacetylase domain-containing protein n=1 Tax=Cutaneotrichosporon spelunceum TaxID=1672016 RepID=A0AAD3Y9S2_9TREE|nr:hypothetical protein CspeluHIS016_0203360 [Cutaneotrichosporon spelunceum]
MTSVAYIWSAALQRAADELPANVGRSSLVHGLIRALGLLENPPDDPDMVKERAWDRGGADGDGRRMNGAERDGDQGEDNGEDDGEDDDGDNTEEPTHRPIRGIRVVPPDLSLGTPTELRRYHDPHYLDYVLQPYSGDSSSDSASSGASSSSSDGSPPPKRRRAAMGLEDDCPRFPALRAYVPLVAAATLTACRELVRGTHTAIVWDGGRHHAARARASGFCYVADAVLGILLLAREGVPRPAGPLEDPPTASGHQRLRRPRILYLDMDLHYGDGVAGAFTCPTPFAYPLTTGGRARSPQVLTLSVHHASRGFFPAGAPGLTARDTPHPFSLSLPLAAFAHAPTYARVWACVERVRAAWTPDYVVLQLGVDGMPGDRVGQWGAWSPHGVGGSTWVAQRVLAWGVPTAVLGGGGYEHANCARAWALATAAIVGREMGAETEVPDHENFGAFAPGFTLEVPESHVPDESSEEALAEAEETFAVLAERIREIVAL